MPKLFKLLRGSGGGFGGGGNQKKRSYDNDDELSSSSLKASSSSTALLKNTTNINKLSSIVNNGSKNSNGGIFRSMIVRPKKTPAKATSTVVTNGSDHPTIEAAITYTLSEDEADRIAIDSGGETLLQKQDILFSPNLDIESQVFEDDNENEDSTPAVNCENTEVNTQPSEKGEIDVDFSSPSEPKETVVPSSVEAVDEILDDVDEMAINTSVQVSEEKTTPTISNNKRNVDKRAIESDDCSSDNLVCERTSNKKSRTKRENEKTMTFTQLEVMKNEWSHMMQIAEKDSEIARMKRDADDAHLQHEAVIASKDAEILRAKIDLSMAKTALTATETKLLREKQQHAQTIETLMKTQYEYHELKHSPKSWTFPSFFCYN